LKTTGKVDMNSNIFEVTNEKDINDNSNKKPFRIKTNIKFHLYISSAPCGDGRIFSMHDNISADNHPNRKVRGLLRTKLESGKLDDINVIFFIHHFFKI
jgi:double stranded RNA-specific editase B